MKISRVGLQLLFMASIEPAVAANDPFAKARADIKNFCIGKAASCVAEQKQEMAHFVTMMAAFKDPANRNAKSCMQAAKLGNHIDWPKAANCMRQRVRGKAIGT